jgi:hypothetical protein
MVTEIDNYLREHKEEIVNLVEHKGNAENIRALCYRYLISCTGIFYDICGPSNIASL